MKTDSPSSKKPLLIIFYRNPELGKVKTRLAATIGDAKALIIYGYLSAHTQAVTKNLLVDKAVFYSHYIDAEDTWNNDLYQKQQQFGIDLGERMLHAFREGFQAGYDTICIIGTDCFDLSSTLVEDAFSKLEFYDAVIGPAKDGGYYLLGMNTLHLEFFKDKEWSTSSVLTKTIHDFQTLGLKYYELPVLTDVDEEDDLPEELRRVM